MAKRRGRVFLVGAGPGDAGLITVRGVECLAMADVVIYDPRGTRTVHQTDLDENVDYTPYEGWRISGRVRDVFVRGSAAVLDGVVVGDQSGQFIACGPSDGAIR